MLIFILRQTLPDAKISCDELKAAKIAVTSAKSRTLIVDILSSPRESATSVRSVAPAWRGDSQDTLCEPALALVPLRVLASHRIAAPNGHCYEGAQVRVS